MQSNVGKFSAPGRENLPELMIGYCNAQENEPSLGKDGSLRRELQMCKVIGTV